MKHYAAALLTLFLLVLGFYTGYRAGSHTTYVYRYATTIVSTPRPVSFAQEQHACYNADHQSLSAILNYVSPTYRSRARKQIADEH
jgi:predicted transporter